MKRMEADLNRKVLRLQQEITSVSNQTYEDNREKVIIYNFYYSVLAKVAINFLTSEDKELLIEELNLIYTRGDTGIIEYVNKKLDKLTRETVS
ncbi:hypothetical protein [Oceanobacillus luteolus]|uniref:Phage protein n=1 Tax=Oceanobacillus luteolus TaxID=1274358 RepID=A0ABW4HPC0_9BACI